MTGNPAEDRWLSAKEAAVHLGYTVQTLYNKVAAGEIEPDARIGGRSLRFKRASLDRWVETQNAAATEGVVAA